MLRVEEVLALRPLALGHDQDVSTCHWAQLVRRTAEYPSRRAQLALALVEGGLPPTPDVVALLYRCDDCGRCRASSILPQPPDLARALWPVRAWLVEQGAVTEIDPLRHRLREHGHLYGDLRAAWDSLGPGDAGAETLFVPDGAMLAHDPEATGAALRTARCVAGPVALLTGVPDSGRMLRELGLAAEADEAEANIRGHISKGGYRQVMAGTPKEAVALAEVLAGLPLQVAYIGTALAQAAIEGRVQLRALAGQGRRLVLHASAALLYGRLDYGLLEQWLGQWLGDCFCPEPDAQRLAWPAAVERPAIGLNPALARRLAQRRLDSLMALKPDLILTCDPFSQRALRAAAPSEIEVMDLLAFAMPPLSEA